MLLCSLSLTISSILDYVCGTGLEKHSFLSKLIDADKHVLQSISHLSVGDNPPKLKKQQSIGSSARNMLFSKNQALQPRLRAHRSIRRSFRSSLGTRTHVRLNKPWKVIRSPQVAGLEAGKGCI